jgi:DNA-binding MarR family transcriptional regulator
VLSHLYRNGGINQAGLADLMEIEPITVDRQLDRMEEAGWIARRPDPSDRRVHRIYMTPKAQGVLDQMRELSRDIYAGALDGIAPEAREQLMASLNTEVAWQAMMIAYLDDFKLMMFVALLAVPMLLLLRNPRRSSGPDAHAAALE